MVGVCVCVFVFGGDLKGMGMGWGRGTSVIFHCTVYVTYNFSYTNICIVPYEIIATKCIITMTDTGFDFAVLVSFHSVSLSRFNHQPIQYTKHRRHNR